MKYVYQDSGKHEFVDTYLHNECKQIDCCEANSFNEATKIFDSRWNQKYKFVCSTCNTIYKENIMCPRCNSDTKKMWIDKYTYFKTHNYPERETIIQKDEILNLRIELEITGSIDEFINNM